MMGAQSPSIKPPDLWIHHDQMELKSMEKSSQGSLDTSSGCGQGSTNTYDGPDTHVTIHHVPQSTSSLEKSNYASSYVGMYCNLCIFGHFFLKNAEYMVH